MAKTRAERPAEHKPDEARIKHLEAENQVLRDRLAELEQRVTNLSVKLDKLF